MQQGGLSAARDATVTHSCAPSHLRIALVGPSVLADHKSERKLAKYRDFSDRYDVRPFAVETLGSMSKTARDLTKTLARTAPTRVQSSTAKSRSRFRQETRALLSRHNRRPRPNINVS